MAVAPPQPSSSAAGRMLSVRRADWRFLLARPRLGRVVCLGEHDPELVAALREVGDDVRVGVPGDGDGNGIALFDVVVLVMPTREELARAPALLRPRGWVYVEIGGLRGGRRRRGTLRGVAASVRALRRLGFEHVAAHWHFPNFDSCLEIVPLGDRRAVSLSLRRRQRRLGTRLQVLAARLALRLRLLPYLVPSASVIASLPPSPTVRGPDVTPIVELLSGLSALPQEARALGSTVLVTPREPTSGCVVALVLDARTGEPALVVKLPRLAEAEGEAAIVREAEALTTIQALRPTATVPSVVALTSVEGHMLLVESALVGETISPSELRRHPRRCVEDVLRWLLELPQPRRGPARFDELVDLPLRRFAAALPPGVAETSLVAETLEAVDELRRAALPAVVEHGDLSHPNLIRMADGRVGVVDWELAEVDGLPAADLCFFLGYVAATARRARSPRQLRAAFDDAFAGPGGWARGALLTYADRVGIEPSHLTPLVVATWARYAARFADRVDGAAATPAGSRDAGGVSKAALAALRQSPHLVLWEHALRTRPRFEAGA
jgi:aminoglycoside phosphotransferase